MVGCRAGTDFVQLPYADPAPPLPTGVPASTTVSSGPRKFLASQPLTTTTMRAHSLSDITADHPDHSQQPVNVGGDCVPGEASSSTRFIPPILLLSFELLSDIFMLACEADVDPTTRWRAAAYTVGDEAWSDGPPCRQALILSHVSHNFRQVATNTAPLWTAIHAIEDGTHRPLSKLCLSRTKNCLLDLFISPLPLWYRPDRDCTLSWPSVFESLGSASRWRSLHLHTTYEETLVALLRLSSDPTPHLAHVELLCELSCLSLDDPTRCLKIFNSAKPQLRSLVVDGPRIQWSATLLSTLLELDLTIPIDETYPQIHTYLDMLRHAPHLEKLAIKGGSIIGLPDREDLSSRVSNTVSLVSVKHFTLGNLEPGPLSLILATLFIPAVQHLTLQYWDDFDWGGSFSYDQPLGFVTPARFPALRSLRLVWVNIDNFVGFGRQFTAVEELELCGDEIVFEELMGDLSPNDARQEQLQFPETKSDVPWIEAEPDNEDLRSARGAAFPGLKCLKIADTDALTASQVCRWLCDRIYSKGLDGPLLILLDRETVQSCSVSDIETILEERLARVTVDYYDKMPCPRSRQEP